MPNEIIAKKVCVKITTDLSEFQRGLSQFKDGLGEMKQASGAAKNETGQNLSGLTDTISKSFASMNQSLTGGFARLEAAVGQIGAKLDQLGAKTAETKTVTEESGKAARKTAEDWKLMANASAVSNERIAALSTQLEELNDHKKRLEGQGYGLGFAAYDDVVAQISHIKAEMKSYRDSLEDPVSVSVQAGGLTNLTAQLKQFKADLASMERAGFGLGDANYDAKYQQMAALTNQVKAYKAELTGAAGEESRAGSVLSGIGRVGRSAFQGLSLILGTVSRGFQSLRQRVQGTNGGLDRTVRSIRNIGIVSLGLRLCGGIFGELRSIVSSYIQTNETLHASVQRLKNGLGQALAPAINVVINALSKLLPYVIGVVDAIASLVTNLFGGGWTTISTGASAAAEATNGAAAAQEKYNRTLMGFDQITKLDDNSASSGGSGGGAASSTTTGGEGIAGKLPQWLADLAAQINVLLEQQDFTGIGTLLAEKFGDGIDKLNELLTSGSLKQKLTQTCTNVTDGINGFFAQMVLVDDTTASSIAYRAGEAVGNAINLVFGVGGQFLSQVNFEDIGKTLADMLNGAVETADWAMIGTTIGNYLLALPRTLWETAKNVNWGSLVAGLLKGLGAALGTIGSYIGQEISEAVDGAEAYWAKSVEAAGGDLALGILIGVLKGLQNIGTWIKTNIFDPFIDGFKSAFGIHSPASAPELVEAAEDVGLGILEGIGSMFSDMGDWVMEHIVDPIVEAVNAGLSSVQSIGTGAIQFTASVKNDASQWWSDVKNWWDSKVGKVKEFTTSVTNEASTWWSNVKSWWGSQSKSGVSVTAKVGLKRQGWTSLSDYIGSFSKSIGLKLTWNTGGLSSLQKAVAKVLFGSAKWPNLKFAARGGIVDRATLLGGNLIAGEAGKEAIIPLENHTEWIDMVADRVAQRVGRESDGGQNRTITVYVQLDGKTVGRSVVDYAIGVANTTGQLPWAAYT